MATSDVLKVNQQFLNRTPEDTDVFGITQQKPKFPQYAVVSKRLESFKTWPDYLPVTPEVLVEAGLVYTGVGDSVRCFYCGGGLRNWERNDSPWEEHARWYTDCPHVLLVKGQEFVKRVKAGERPDSDGPKSEVVETVSSQLDLINTPAAQACLQMGYKKEQVQKAVDIYFQRSGGSTDFKGKDIAEILTDLEDEEFKMEVSHSRNVADSRMQACCAENVADSGMQACCAENVADSRMEDVTEEEEIESVEELYEENRRLKENQLCKICLDAVADVIFLPCGHMVSCPQCAPAMVKCPICRMSVKGIVKAYFATN